MFGIIFISILYCLGVYLCLYSLYTSFNQVSLISFIVALFWPLSLIVGMIILLILKLNKSSNSV